MKKILFLVSLFFAFSASAGEVLVLTTATRVDPTPLGARKGIEIQNNGPNTISCQLRTSTGLTTTKGRLVQPGEAWALGASSSTAIYCLALTANQVTGAATFVTEVP